MQVVNRRRLRKQLHQVLEDWISEELGDSSDEDESNYFRSTSRRSMMDSKFTDQSNVHSSDVRTSSRLSSSSSTATDHLPPPPKYESVIQRPVKDYSSSSGSQQTQWEKEINQIVGGFDTNCSTREGVPAKRLSSGTQSYVHEEKTSRSSMTPSATGHDRNYDWDKDLLSNDSFFRDSPFRQRIFADRPFGAMRSRFGEDIDRFFGRGTFSTDWDTFFPEITFSDFGHSSSSLGKRAISDDTRPANQEEDFKLEVDVQGFEPHELLVKTVGHSLVVMAKTEASDGNERGISRKREFRFFNANHVHHLMKKVENFCFAIFRELRKEFTIPTHINPTDISSNLTPDGILVIEAPAGNTMAIQSRDDDRKSGE